MFLDNQPKVIHHSKNESGRDFIVGDLHGCRSMLDDLLSHVGFDAQQDRLFSVGDLVDRGPDSVACLELLKEPWFFPVLGNHDAMLMAWILGNRKDKMCRTYEGAFIMNHGWEWAKRFTRAGEFLPLLQKMPLVRVVGAESDSRFNLVHAELYDEQQGAWSDTDLDCPDETPWQVKHWVIGFDDVGTWIDHALWGRNLRFAMSKDAQVEVDGLSTTYCGHTITPPRQGQLFQYGNHVFLDTGAFTAQKYAGRGLTLWSPTERQGWFCQSSGIEEVFLQKRVSEETVFSPN